MVHTRETRTCASEIKFLIDPVLAPRIRDWARTELEADPHGLGPYGDEYETTSLYFDTRHFDVFHRHASFARAKYRIRRYGDSECVFFERKLRKPALLIKRRTMASMDAMSHLQDVHAPSGWGADWFRQRLRVRRLQPVCQVSYRRTARTTETNDGPARLTLDSDLRVVSTSDARFSAEPGRQFLAERMILELKYCVRVPAIFRRLVEDFALTTETASKYRLGMAALGHIPAPSREAVKGSNVFYA